MYIVYAGGMLLIYILMVISSIEDIVRHEVKVLYCCLFVAGNLLLTILMHHSLMLCVTGLIPGVILMVCNRILPDKVGMADIAFIMGAGLLLGFWDTALILLAGLLCASLYGLILMVRKEKGMHYELALIPFLSFFYFLETGNVWR